MASPCHALALTATSVCGEDCGEQRGWAGPSVVAPPPNPRPALPLPARRRPPRAAEALLPAVALLRRAEGRGEAGPSACLRGHVAPSTARSGRHTSPALWLRSTHARLALARLLRHPSAALLHLRRRARELVGDAHGKEERRVPDALWWYGHGCV